MIERRRETFTEDIFHLLIKLNETKRIFSGSMHKTRQIHLQFQNFSLSKRNENFQNWLRSDRTQNRNVHIGNVLLITKAKRSVYFF